MRRPTGEIVRQEPALLKFVDRDVLREFYARQYATGGYTSAPQVYAGDLNCDSVQARAGEVPHQSWAVFDAESVPFRDAQFDGLFAGEIIEHVLDARRTLREWWRVLKPGGVAIITTPNRERLVAVADGLESPCSRDHLRELSYRKLTRDVLSSCGCGTCVEAVFRSLKSELGLRPIYHHKPRRADGHLFLTVIRLPAAGHPHPAASARRARQLGYASPHPRRPAARHRHLPPARRAHPARTHDHASRTRTAGHLRRARPRPAAGTRPQDHHLTDPCPRLTRVCSATCAVRPA